MTGIIPIGIYVGLFVRMMRAFIIGIMHKVIVDICMRAFVVGTMRALHPPM